MEADIPQSVHLPLHDKLWRQPSFDPNKFLFSPCGGSHRIVRVQSNRKPLEIFSFEPNKMIFCSSGGSHRVVRVHEVGGKKA